MEEIWKDIPNYEGAYQVSNLGRIKSLKYKGGIIIKDRYGSNGYMILQLSKNGHKESKLVHRVVLLTFKPDKYFEGAVCNHINNVISDNRLDNLEWCTQKENIQHMVRQNRQNKAKGEKSGKSILSDLEVLDVLRLYKEGNKQTHIAKYYKVSSSCINHIVSGRRRNK